MFTDVIEIFKMFTKTIFLCTFMITSTITALDCSSLSWILYKQDEDYVTGKYNIDSEKYELSFALDRTIDYQCSSDNLLQFCTRWSINTKVNRDYSEVQQFRSEIIVQTCKAQPCNGNIVLKITVYRKDRDRKWHDWSNWKPVSEFSHLMKDCNKLHWTNWIETTNCETSPNITFKRSCVDCDGDALEQKYCDATGQAILEKKCNHYWGTWTEGTCVTTGCNSIGEQVITRQCLYNDGLEAATVWLCSNGNESAVLKQKCTNNIIPGECKPQSSSGTGNSDNTGFYVGIGVAVALIVILCILLIFVRHRRLKAADFPSDNLAKPNFSFPYGFTNFTVKADKQSNDVPRPPNVSHQNPADAYEFANPTTSANDRGFKDVKHAKRDMQEAEPEEEPVVYDFAQIDGSNPQSFEQVPGQDVNEIATPDISNAYEIATLADPTVYEIKDHPIQQAKSNFSTAQSIEGEPEQSNAYSSFQSLSDAVESTYSRLKR